MDEERLKSLPGAEIVLPGIEDLRHGRDSVNTGAVRGARGRLAHARYNAILARMDSFARAAELARAR